MRPEERPQLLLWGFMGSGKSTVGRILADRRGLRFCDLDQAIEAQLRRSIPDIFADEGERAFRAYEKRALFDQLDRRGPAVIALGGGALIDDESRRRALSTAWVVTLRASIATLEARIAGSDRPLLSSADLDQLYKRREAAYGEAHRVIDTDALTPETVARRLDRDWSPTT